MNKDNTLTNPLLIQVSKALRAYFNMSGQSYVVRERVGQAGQLIRIFTNDTDHGVRISIVDSNPTNIHVRRQKFTTVYDDEACAGWGTISTFDVNTIDAAPELTQSQLNAVVYEVATHLVLTAKNTRRPRSRFPVRMHTCVPESKHLAAAFNITGVVLDKKEKTLTLLGDNGLKHKLSPTITAKFSNPSRIPGCLAVIHESGTVRVLRYNNFNILYEEVKETAIA